MGMEATLLEPPTTRLFREIQDELDPEQKHNPERFTAALNKLGLYPVDVSKKPLQRSISLHPKVPAPNVAGISKQRSEVQLGLREQRVRAVASALNELKGDDVRRYNQIDSAGVRPIDWKRDIPPIDDIGDMGTFEEAMRKRHEQAQKDQKRKANALATGFLMEKKRMDEADASLEALEKRLKDYEQMQTKKWNDRRKALQAKTERREKQVEAVAEARRVWEDETEAKLKEKLENARAKRAETYSPHNLQAKAQVAQTKRDRCFADALRLETELLNSIEERQRETEERLKHDRELLELKRQKKREKGEQETLERQVKVHTALEDWAEKRYQSHMDCQKQFDANRAAGQDFYQTRAKNIRDYTTKSFAKWSANHEKIEAERGQDNIDLMKRHEDAQLRCEERAAMKLKCDNDIYSYSEVRYGTWGELTQSRRRELQRMRDNYTQVTLFKIAEQVAAQEAKAHANQELENKRQSIARDLLAQKTLAEEAFIRMKCESDPEKIRKTMTGLGFEMPKLPEPEKADAEEQEKPAY